MDYLVIGILVSQKEETRFTSLYLAVDFADYLVESANRCEGQEVAKVVTVLDCSKISVGDHISLTYAPSASGKARLVAIQKV